MSDILYDKLSRRERQIIDVLYRLGEAGAAEIAAHLPDRPAYNTVRVTLGVIEKKGFVRHRRDGQRYVYAPTIPVERAKRSAMSHVLKTFFRNSPTAAIMALLDQSPGALSDDELAEIGRLVQRAKKKDGAP
jgi:predicted transcriptional regulator